jgi:hypothetical protein
MWQEILVFGIFFAVLGIGTYRLLFRKKSKKKSSCGCDGC